MILGAFIAALGQLGDRRFRRVVLWGVLLALLLLVAVYALFLLAIVSLAPDSVTLPFFGQVQGVHDLLGWLSLAVMLLLSVFLMQPAALAFAGLFVEDVAAAVEARHYAWLPPARPVPFVEGLKQAVNLIGMMIILNILILPLSLTFGAPLVPVFFFLANGFLLGREYFSTVAARRLPPEAMQAIRARYRLRIWLAGALMSVPLTIPLVNLLVPVLGTATFTHLFHKMVAADQR